MPKSLRNEQLRLSNEETNRITKESIESALLLLIREKPLDRISITDIARRAGVSRTAYYRNYTSKENILQTMLQDVVRDVTQTMQLEGSTTDTEDYWRAMFRVVKKYTPSLDILLKTHHWNQILHEVNRQIQPHVQRGDAEESYQRYFYCGAAYNVLTAWLNGGMKEPIDEMAKMCCRFASGA
ncbi:TetR/AcrR family transcriptional regulator [Eubacteriales bacterium OttesenSCG-928-N13]|nr:TetR/AcrR family transcriptional regulator [Eubacteriales bacterium OttesenSCG-928-N13]